MFSEQYHLLSQEAHLTKSSLLSGLDSLKKANLDDRGLFYSGLFQLSIGLERLMKIVVLLDYKVENSYSNPTNRELRSYGHNIEQLYEKCSYINSKYNNGIAFDIDDKQKKILNVVSSFGTGARYYNLDKISSSNHSTDPLVLWASVITEHIWGLRPSIRRKLESDAIEWVDKNGSADSWYPGRNINGELMMMSEYHYLFHATAKASGHVIWSIISILEPFYFLLQRLTFKLHELQDSMKSSQQVPHIYEYFPFFLSLKEQVLRKREWKWSS